MSTIQFTVNLGAGSINVLAGIAFFFGLKNSSPYELDSMSVDSDSLSEK